MYFNPKLSVEDEQHYAKWYKEQQAISEKEAREKIREHVVEVMPSKSGMITEDRIERARNHDIASLFVHKKGYMVKCPFHDDDRESASIKKGVLICFACGKVADAISVYRQLHGVGFREAVEALS